MSQFAFLKDEFTPVYEHARKAEILALSDPRGSCFYARLALETAVGWMYQHDGSLRSLYDNALSALIREATFFLLPRSSVGASSEHEPLKRRRCIPTLERGNEMMRAA